MNVLNQRLPFPETPKLIGKSPAQIGQATVKSISTSEILTRATGFMDAYDFTLNPYAGCSFGCTYCYAAFFSHSKEERDSWGLWVKIKENAIERLKRRRFGSLNGKLIYMSSVTDPYQPIEREVKLTRQLLEILAQRHQPKLVVQTRSPDIVRDIDMFHLIVKNGGYVQVNITVTTDDEDIRRTFEPYCPDNRGRLRAARELCDAGIDTCITMTPLLLVRDVESFTMSLIETGVKKFISQPFHFQQGKFVAATRTAALNLMAEKLSCEVSAFRKIYIEHYRNVRDVLKARLPGIGEGKDGFAPPF